MAILNIKVFKFQSDSINTYNQLEESNGELTLNSNLILLILDYKLQTAAKKATLNSNLILLILLFLFL